MAILETDPVDWELDADGQLIFPIRFTRGTPAVAQRLRIKLKMFRGEWFLNRRAGTPYIENETVTEDEAILGNAFDEAYTESVFRELILSTEGVERIDSLTTTFSDETRVLDVAATVVTIYGHAIDLAVARELFA
jgi:hypothetical protein